MANNDPMQIDVTLQTTDPLNVSLGEMYKGGDGSFAGLSDVALDNPTNGQVPKYNSETEKWENADDNTVSNLTDLEDVNISNPTDGQIVRYDAETDKFIASDEQVGSEVSVTQIQSTGTKVATITVDEVDTDIYAPDPTSVSVTQTQVSGTKVGEISVDGQTTELFAPTPSSPTEVTVTQIQSTGTKIATITVDNVPTDLYAPEGGGSGGHTILDDSGTALTQRSNMQFKGAYSNDNSTDSVTEVNISREMTYAEFEQLSDDEKVGLINVTDVTPSGDDRFQPVIYSEEEREIGVWTDGKPLYEKTYDLGSAITVSQNSWSSTGITITDIDLIVFCSALAGDGSYQSSLLAYNKNGTLNLQTPRNSETTIKYVTIRYTKTTDTAGSGQWTPQGVPAVHYSTDEQVVGTWIDGSTLYEKTQYGGISITTADTWYDTSITGIDKAVMVSGTLLRSGEGVGLGTFNSRWIVRNNTVKISLSDLSGDTWSLMSITVRYTKSST